MNRYQYIGFVVSVLFVFAIEPARADIEFSGTIVYGPKLSPASALIGEVTTKLQSIEERARDQSTHISMDKAEVDLFVGPISAEGEAFAVVSGSARFTMRNTSNADQHIIVGFPLGSRKYGAYRFLSFAVRHEGVPLPVFFAEGGYKIPLKMTPLDIETKAIPPEADTEGRMYTGLDYGRTTIDTSIIWEAVFKANSTEMIEVEYSLEIPLQAPNMIAREIIGTYNSMRLKADSIPEKFSQPLDAELDYVFFSYILASGASWRGSIGREVVRVTLDKSWGNTPVDLYRMMGNELQGVTDPRDTVETISAEAWNAGEDGLSAVVFERENFEPGEDDNLHFALAAGRRSRTIGMATMQPDGTIVLYLRAEDGQGTTGDAQFTYPPNHQDYRNIKDHLGGIRPGDEVQVKPWEIEE